VVLAVNWRQWLRWGLWFVASQKAPSAIITNRILQPIQLKTLLLFGFSSIPFHLKDCQIQPLLVVFQFFSYYQLRKFEMKLAKLFTYFLPGLNAVLVLPPTPVYNLHHGLFLTWNYSSSHSRMDTLQIKASATSVAQFFVIWQVSVT